MRLILLAAALVAALAVLSPENGVLSGLETSGGRMFELGRAGLPQGR